MPLMIVRMAGWQNPPSGSHSPPTRRAEHPKFSAKRYALFNRSKDGEIILRKVSSHGLGDIRIPASYDPLLHDRTMAEHIAAPLDKETSKRDYGKLAKSPSARLVCDIWRIAVEKFGKRPEGATARIDRIISTLAGMNTPQMTQMTLSSSHLMQNYKDLPNKRGFQFFSVFPGPIDDPTNYFDNSNVRLDERRALMDTSLYASVDRKKFRPETIDQWKQTKEGIYRRDNSEFPHGLFDPNWQLQFQTVAQRLSGYFDRVEAKSRGREGVLERKRVVSLEKHYIGKETNPLATVDSDFPDDDTLVDFAASQFIVAGQEVNWGAIEPHFEVISKASGIGIDILRRAHKERRGLNAENMARLRSVLHIDEDGVIEVHPPKIDARKLAQWPRVLASLEKCGKFHDVAAIMECEVADVPICRAR